MFWLGFLAGVPVGVVAVPVVVWSVFRWVGPRG